MITEHMAREMLENLKKPKKPDLILEERKGKYIAYFKTKADKVAVGNTEIEALENLRILS